MHTREALLRDATQIHDLIASYSGDGTLLRTLPEICETFDFVVVENEGRIVGCGALHLYGPHLAEVRSISAARCQRQGAGRQLIDALLEQTCAGSDLRMHVYAVQGSSRVWSSQSPPEEIRTSSQGLSSLSTAEQLR
jgi:N-acetylglutamate synthase-like GNAT family acetyltransferase